MYNDWVPKCFNGPSCSYLAEGRCHYFHPRSHYNNNYRKPYYEFNYFSAAENNENIQFKNTGDINDSSSSSSENNENIQFEKIIRNIFDNSIPSSPENNENILLENRNKSHDHDDDIDQISQVHSIKFNDLLSPLASVNQAISVEELIRTKSFKEVTKENIQEFLQSKSLKSTGTKTKLWIDARNLLGLPISDEEIAENNRNKPSLKKFISETTNVFLKEFQKTFVVPTSILRMRVSNKYLCSSHTFGQQQPLLQERYGIGTVNSASLRNIGNDFSVGLSAPRKTANIVFFAPKKQRVLAFFSKLNGDMSFDKPLTSYFENQDHKMWSQIIMIDGKIAVLQREAGYTDFEESHIDSFQKNCFEPYKKEWGFFVELNVYISAWESFIEFQKNDFEGINTLDDEIRKHFSVKVNRFNVRRMKKVDLKKACVERGLIKEKAKFGRESLVERLMRVL